MSVTASTDAGLRLLIPSSVRSVRLYWVVLTALISTRIAVMAPITITALSALLNFEESVTALPAIRSTSDCRD